VRFLPAPPPSVCFCSKHALTNSATIPSCSHGTLELPRSSASRNHPRLTSASGYNYHHPPTTLDYHAAPFNSTSVAHNMADSEFSLAFMAWMLATNHSAFRITLRTIDGYEGFESREFDLCVGGTFPIGRASKNTTKKTLMPAPSNAYIDSPVISREHALLSADTQLGTPHVYITDTGSMHGTMVNDERLPPHTPKQLASGDKLQFGIDVNRNEGTHSPACIPVLIVAVQR
jgi:hypothetical protein